MEGGDGFCVLYQGGAGDQCESSDCLTDGCLFEGKANEQLALQFSGVERMEEGQVNIDGFFAAKASPPVSGHASPIPKPDLKQSHPSSNSTNAIHITSTHSAGTDGAKPPLPASWQCDKCLRIFDLPSIMSEADEDLQMAEEQARAEHADYHFALELSRTVEPGYSTAPAGTVAASSKRERSVKAAPADVGARKKIKKEKDEDKGSIRAFLQPKKDQGKKSNGRR